MRARVWLCVMPLLTGSCDRVAPRFPKRLVDGCYYAGGKPIFKISGDRGQVLIPGNVKTFMVIRGRNPFHAYATFSPGFLFAGVEAAPSQVDNYGQRTYSMKAGTSVPTIEMQWEAYGEEDVSLGKPC